MRNAVIKMSSISNDKDTINAAGSESSSLLNETVTSPLPNKMNLRKKCWDSDRKIQVDILAGLFGISAWLAVNGMFTQLPILVQSAPEGWNLPSYLSILIQAANIGPLLYSLSQKYCPRLISDSKLIYLILVVGSASLISMGLYYDHISFVFGEPHSVVMFINAFFIALVGCTSSVLFIPFLNNYPEVYLISYLVGEGLSGFIPSIIALVQGVGGNPSCVNSTSVTGEVISVPYTPPPNFSPEVFFFVLFCLMAVSTISFFLLNNLPSCKALKERSSTNRKESLNNSPVTPTIDMFMEPDTFTPTSDPPDEEISLFMFKVFLVMITIVSMVANGALPSAQSYSCLPYGNLAYHLAVNLGNMANPAACFLAYFVPHTDPAWVISLFSLSGIGIAVVLTTATMSPSPPLQHSGWGTLIIVSEFKQLYHLILLVYTGNAALNRVFQTGNGQMAQGGG